MKGTVSTRPHKVQILAILALALISGCSEKSQRSNDPWAGGPQVEETANQGPNQSGNQGSANPSEMPQQQASAGNSQGKNVHPAAEPVAQQGSSGNCLQMHPGGMPPVIVNKEYEATVKPTYRQLCYRAFHLGHSGLTRTAIWSAEILDPQRMNMAQKIERDSAFAADDRLPESERSELDDYRKSGFDRGHLAPSGDMPSREAQAESFRLSNIVPQNGRMNGGPWRDLEINVRQEAKKARVFVVTGPIFNGSNQALRKRVLVPTALYKAMYVVNKGAVVFIMDNNQQAKTTTLSLDQFTRIYGIDPFPALTGQVRSHNIALGPIKFDPNKGKDGANGGENGENGSNDKAGCKGTQYRDEKGVWMNEDVFYKKYGQYAVNTGIRSCGGIL